MWFLFQLTILLTVFTVYSIAYNYRFVLDDFEIFSECPNQPKNVLDIKNAFDLSELNITSDFEFLYVSGNVTSVWNIQPSDRIEASLELLRFDRGEWFNTFVSITVKDYCSVLYSEWQYWYKFWTKHIINLKDIKSKCFLPGTKLVQEPFKVDVTANLNGPRMEGPHKIVYKLKAFDLMQRERPTSICFEILGEMTSI